MGDRNKNCQGESKSIILFGMFPVKSCLPQDWQNLSTTTRMDIQADRNKEQKGTGRVDLLSAPVACNQFGFVTNIRVNSVAV